MDMMTKTEPRFASLSMLLIVPTPDDIIHQSHAAETDEHLPPRRHEPHSLPARRHDETMRDTRIEASTGRRYRGSQTQKNASP